MPISCGLLFYLGWSFFFFSLLPPSVGRALFRLVVAGSGGGQVRLLPVGELLPAHGPPAHQGLQDVQEPQELHHHQAGLAGEFVTTGE